MWLALCGALSCQSPWSQVTPWSLVGSWAASLGMPGSPPQAPALYQDLPGVSSPQDAAPLQMAGMTGAQTFRAREPAPGLPAWETPTSLFRLVPAEVPSPSLLSVAGSVMLSPVVQGTAVLFSQGLGALLLGLCGTQKTQTSVLIQPGCSVPIPNSPKL